MDRPILSRFACVTLRIGLALLVVGAGAHAAVGQEAPAAGGSQGAAPASNGSESGVKPGTAEAPKPSSAKAPAPAAKAQPQGGTSAVVVDLSALESVIGKSVKSAAGEDLGRIVDLLVTTSGQVRAAVIDFGGILGVGSRKVAVDWKALDFSNFTKDGTVKLGLTRNQVRVSPEYKSGEPVVILQEGKPEDGKADDSKPNGNKAGNVPADQAPPAANNGSSKAGVTSASPKDGAAK